MHSPYNQETLLQSLYPYSVVCLEDIFGGKMAPPDLCGTYCSRKKGQTVWITPEDNDGLGVGINMPDHGWEGGCSVNNSLVAFLTDINELYWIILYSYPIQWHLFQSYQDVLFVILNLRNYGGPCGHSIPRQCHRNYSLLQSHLLGLSIILSLLIILCKTLFIFLEAEGHSYPDISAPSDPFPTSGVPGSTFHTYSWVWLTALWQCAKPRKHKCQVDTKCSIKPDWLALSVIQWNLFSYARSRAFLLPTWT